MGNGGKKLPKVSGMFLLSLVTSESLIIVPSFLSVLKRNRPDSSSSSSSSSDSSFMSFWSSKVSIPPYMADTESRGGREGQREGGKEGGKEGGGESC